MLIYGNEIRRHNIYPAYVFPYIENIPKTAVLTTNTIGSIFHEMIYNHESLGLVFIKLQQRE